MCVCVCVCPYYFFPSVCDSILFLCLDFHYLAARHLFSRAVRNRTVTELKNKQTNKTQAMKVRPEAFTLASAPGMGGDQKCLLGIHTETAGEVRPMSQEETKLQKDVTCLCHTVAKWRSQEESPGRPDSPLRALSRTLQPPPFSRRPEQSGQEAAFLKVRSWVVMTMEEAGQGGRAPA